jgi:hypothetical protein
MPLKEQEFSTMLRRVEARGGLAMTMISPKAAIAAVLAALLGGCVDSAAPLLTGAQPVFGPDVKVHVYLLGESHAAGPEIGVYHWDGHEYRALNKPSFEIAAFTAIPLAGNDLIIQSRSTRPQIKGVEYGIARKIAPSTYMVSAIDEEEADAATRAKFCATGGSDSCHVTTQEGLLALARAAAAKPELKGSLAILVGEDKP